MDSAVVKLLVFVGLFLIFVPVASRRLRKERDPEWEGRWKELPLRERIRISTGVRRGERFEDPDEAYLAAGSARQQGSFADSFSHSSILRLMVPGLVLLAAIADGSLLMIVFGSALLAFFGWIVYRDRVTRQNLARAAEKREP